MWRYYYWQWRYSVEDYFKRLTIKGLKPFLNRDREFQSWSYWWGNNWTISVDMTKWKTSWYIRVYFTQTGYDWVKKDLDYNIKLVSTPCNYGWVRRWFECPCKWNRCNILYLQNNWIFASRKTLDLCYDDQKKSKRWRYFSYLSWMNQARALALYRTIKYPYRNWKETKKLKRFIKLSTSWPTLEEVNKLRDFF